MKIDFSALPKPRVYNTPLQNMLTALGIVAVIGGLLGIGALVNYYVKNDVTTTLIAVVLGVGYFLLWPAAVYVFIRKKRLHARNMQKFADDNGFNFTGPRQVLDDTYVVPLSGMRIGATWLQYSVHDQSNTFMLYGVIGVRPGTRLARKGVLIMTVIRIAGHQSVRLDPDVDMMVQKGDGYTYIAQAGNVVDRERMLKLFQTAGLVN